MLKGTQKRIIYIKDTRSRIFGEAYFVLKTDVGTEVSENEMVVEAARIVDENLLSVYCSNQLASPKMNKIEKKEKSKTVSIAGFVGGVSICSAAAALILLAVKLLG